MKKWTFIAGCLAIVWLLQALLVPKYMESAREGALTGEYYANAGGNDVIFLGDCEVYENFSPITLWEEYGIPSYIRGSAQQMIWQSYYLLEEMLSRETPKVVVFNVLAMKYDTPESTGSPRKREAYNRMSLDTMRWSPSKWHAIRASMTEGESMASYFLPILRYHDRWHQLTGEDVAWWFRREPVSHNGYLMQTGVKPVGDAYSEPPVTDFRLGENSWHYLEKMRLLCQEHGVALVLIKAPSLSPIWYDQWDEQIREYARRHELRYWNLREHVQDIGIDWTQDTYDAGLHLNVWGAEKATVWLGAELSREFDLPDRRSDPQLSALWDEKIYRYYLEKENHP